MWSLLACTLLLLQWGEAVVRPCARRDFIHPAGETAFSCICNATYCDDIAPLGTLKKDDFAVYLSDRETNRLQRIDWHFTGFPNTTNTLTIDVSKTFQTIMGFGGAITDSVGINLQSLSAANQDQVMKAYYGQEGLQYTFCRIPIASCDFSLTDYSYDDVPGDFNLTHFNLTKEDFEYKIPLVKKAKALTTSYGNDFKLYTTAWSSPGWMKNTGKMKGGGELLGEMNGPYYTTWAQYYKRYFEEYHKQGIDFWGVTPGNEPTSGADENYGWQALYFSAESQRDFIKTHFGPMLQSSDITKNIKLMIGDDQRYVFPAWADTVLGDPEAAKYVSGIAIHWYEDWLVSDEVLRWTNEKHPDHFMLYTEACTGYLPWEGTPILGDWRRADAYAYDILTDLKTGVVGWVDWNLILDLKGGPNFAKNNVDAPLLANATADEFIKQPMYYALGHFSKFIQPCSKRVHLAIEGAKIEGIAFLAPDNHQRVLVLQNRNENSACDFSIQDAEQSGRYGNVHLPPMSILTVVYTV